jgi:protein-tyrosine phosphatase
MVMDAIRPWLYIGKYQETLDAILLGEYKIGAKLHLADPRNIQSVTYLADRVEYSELTSLYLPVEDGVALPSHLLRQGVDFVLAEKCRGKTVLISCGAGISRSATFAVAVLKEAEGLLLLEAVRIVKQCHPRTRPHPALWESLCTYYHEKVSAYTMLNVLRSLE